MGYLTILIAIFIFGIIIFIHELGHLIFAKKYGVYCYEFSLGMGPKIITRTYGETKYSLRAIPIGGYVAMAGEDDDGKDVPEGRRLPDISKLKQAMVIFAGPLFNFILGFGIIFAVNLYTGEVELQNVVGNVIEDSVASEYGLEQGYEIVEVNGVAVDNYEDSANRIIEAKETGDINVVFEKDGKVITIDEKNVAEDFSIGFSYDSEVTSRNIFTLLKSSFVQFFAMTTAMIKGFAALIFNFSSMKGNVGGPVMVINVIGESAQIGLIYLLQIVAILSVNIAIVNLLPIPGLDGSKIIIAITEYVTKRDLPRKVYIGLSLGGLVFLLLLMVLITFKDIQNLLL